MESQTFYVLRIVNVYRMRTRFLGRLIALLIVSGLVLPSQGAEDTKPESPFSGPKHPLDKATSLRMNLQLLGMGLYAKPACELDTPAGREQELRRAIGVFPEIRKDTEVLKAINADHCFENFDALSPEQQLQLYRRYENLTSIHLEPLGKDSAGFDVYLRTFVPNHQPNCGSDPALKGQSPLVYAENGVVVLRGGYLSMGIGPTNSTNNAPPQNSQPHQRPFHRLEVHRPCGPWPPQPDAAMQK
jgi:hypothetical protein